MARLAAEAVGTGALVVAVVGSGIMATRLTADTALALLANALATAAALVVLISTLRPISGAHLNPAVTAVLAARGEITWAEASRFLAAQLLGALIGVVLAHAMFEQPLLQLGTASRSGPGQWLAEVVATAGLVSVILLAARDRQSALPQVVGLYILAAYWFTASTSFANPAVTVARALTDTFTGIAPADAVGFVIAQSIGATTCIVVVKALAGSRR